MASLLAGVGQLSQLAELWDAGVKMKSLSNVDAGSQLNCSSSSSSSAMSYFAAAAAGYGAANHYAAAFGVAAGFSPASAGVAAANNSSFTSQQVHGRTQYTHKGWT